MKTLIRAILGSICLMGIVACSSGGGDGNGPAPATSDSSNPGFQQPVQVTNVIPSPFLTTAGNVSGHYVVKRAVNNLTKGNQSGHYLIYGGIAH